MSEPDRGGSAARAARCYAVVPAAGRSVRMGRPKLLLPLRGRPLIAHLLVAWNEAGADAVVVVVRRDDDELASCCQQHGAEVVRPETDPPDMKASVLHGLARIERDHEPTRDDYWLLAPADMPLLRAEDLRTVMAACREGDGALVTPTFEGRRGHPAGFPWPLAAEARSLPADQGLNQLVARGPLREVPLASPGVVVDIDTPEQYRRLDDDSDR